MQIVAVVGSPRKGQATDQLVDAALAGCLEVRPQARYHKVHLDDLDIRHCRNCLTCRDNHDAVPYAPCIIKDDMQALYPLLADSDALILGTPIHMGTVSALMLAFLERICWVFSKPGKRYFTLRGCPMPRTAKARKAVVLAVSSLVPPLYRRFCDEATPLIRSTLRDTLNCSTVGDLYAAAAEQRGLGGYLPKARELGRRLAG